MFGNKCEDISRQLEVMTGEVVPRWLKTVPREMQSPFKASD
jgi:hypothetical protein